MSLINCVRRNLEALGLRPERADKVPSLSDYLEQRSNGNGAPDGQRGTQSDGASVTPTVCADTVTVTADE